MSAGAGWGKTSAVADWASKRNLEGNVGWLSLLPDDDGLASFWTAVLHALRVTGRVPADHPLATLRPADEMSEAMLRSMYERMLTLPSPIVLVLDDFQLITQSAVLESITPLVLRDLRLSLVLLTRFDPPLPLHRLRLSGALTEIVADDLALRPAEIAALATAAGHELDDADLGRVHERTDGWPAGVRLAILYLSQQGTAHQPSDFGGLDRSVAEYLVAEVLDRQSQELREFLLQTSVVDLVCADLADAIAPGGRSLHDLEFLERTHQFVTALDTDRRWYRYHPLLREMLEHVLERDEPEQFRTAHARAAQWLAWHGEPVAALRHAVRATDWTLFSTIFVECAFPAVLGPDRQTLAGLLSAIPFADLTPTAPLEICAWALSFLQERLPAMAGHVEVARALLPATPDLVRPATAALVEMIACAAARAASDAPTMRSTGEAALMLLAHVGRPFPALQSLRAVAANNLAVGMLWSGDATSARDLFATAATEALAVELYLPATNALSHLALCELVDGRLDEAENAARTALDLAEPRGVTSRFQLKCAHVTKAYVDVLHGNADAADRGVAAALAAVEGGTEPAPSLAVWVCQALAAVSRRRVRAAEQALSEAETTAKGWDRPAFLDDWLTRATVETRLLGNDPEDLAAGIEQLRQLTRPSVTAQVCLSRLLLASGDAPGAELTARACCESLAEGGAEADAGDALPQVEAWLVRALAADHLRHDYDAAEYLRRALEVAEPQRLLRPFLVASSERLPSLIEACLESSTLQLPIAARLITMLGSPRPPTPEPEPLQEPLTERELTVLAALPTMRTNAEIAERLFVSVNTIKAHLKGLYRKLEVNNRRDAIYRSQALGLLPAGTRDPSR